jgi:hypothetical protein
MDTTRVACNCEHCAEYAQRKSLPFPLAADVDSRWMDFLAAKASKKNHRAVASAYDASIPADHQSRRAFPVSA